MQYGVKKITKSVDLIRLLLEEQSDLGLHFFYQSVLYLDF